MKNKLWFFLAVFFCIIFAIVIYFFVKNFKNSSSDYSVEKTATNSTNIYDNNINTNNIIPETANTDKIKKEELISSFSTKIYTKDSARQNNISLTSSSLNDTIVYKGQTFSFCNTVGQATSDKGYQEADIFDNKGNKKKGLGGGNCQVSTTLYNAILKVQGLVIIERHEHSNKVPYIENGLDAAVAYGSYDLKFRNDMDYDIKIKAKFDSDNVTISLYKI